MQGLGAILLHSPLKALDLFQHILGPGFHFEVGQFAVRIVIDPQFILNSIEHLQNSGQLMFGQQTDVHIQVSAMLGFSAKRFWLMSTKVARKIASSETIMVRRP